MFFVHPWRYYCRHDSSAWQRRTKKRRREGGGGEGRRKRRRAGWMNGGALGALRTLRRFTGFSSQYPASRRQRRRRHGAPGVTPVSVEESAQRETREFSPLFVIIPATKNTESKAINGSRTACLLPLRSNYGGVLQAVILLLWYSTVHRRPLGAFFTSRQPALLRIFLLLYLFPQGMFYPCILWLFLFFYACALYSCRMHLKGGVSRHGGRTTPFMSMKGVTHVIAENLSASKTDKAMKVCGVPRFRSKFSFFSFGSAVFFSCGDFGRRYTCVSSLTLARSWSPSRRGSVPVS